MSLASLTSFRVNAATAARSALVASMFLGGTAFAARAEMVMAAATPKSDASVTIDTDCRTYKPGELMADTKCRIEKGKLLDTQLMKEQQELKQSQQNIVCLRKIKIFLDAGKVSREKILEYGKDRACALAKTLG